MGMIGKGDFMRNEWKNFKEGIWTTEINVADFIQHNYTFYNGNKQFLASISSKTKNVWEKCTTLLQEELKKQVKDEKNVHKIIELFDQYEEEYNNEHGLYYEQYYKIGIKDVLKLILQCLL